jgi:serine/threonine protein kinase
MCVLNAVFRLWIVTELVEQSLADMIRDKEAWTRLSLTHKLEVRTSTAGAAVQTGRSLTVWIWLLYSQLLRDVLQGLIAMHTVNMVHRDIKSHNVLIQASQGGGYTAKVRGKAMSRGRDTESRLSTAQSNDVLCHLQLGDLGSACVMAEGPMATEEVGTSGWTAPEVRPAAYTHDPLLCIPRKYTDLPLFGQVLQGEPYDTKADVFSFGVLMWEVLSGSVSNPLTSLDADRLLAELRKLSTAESQLKLPEVRSLAEHGRREAGVADPCAEPPVMLTSLRMPV